MTSNPIHINWVDPLLGSLKWHEPGTNPTPTISSLEQLASEKVSQSGKTVLAEENKKKEKNGCLYLLLQQRQQW